MSIPLIVINYNQLHYFKKNIETLLHLGFSNIVIIDNLSTFQPLLKYYKSLESNKKITTHYLKKNLGHMAIFKDKVLFAKYCHGFYIITDADIILNPNMPENFMKEILKMLIKNNFFITKVGLALDISDIPDQYILKQQVIKWESQFWKHEIKNNIFYADIDTTFGLYKPQFRPNKFSNFLKGIRMADKYTAKHGGWYILVGELEEERTHYFNNNNSSTWMFDNSGKLQENSRNKIYEK